MCMQGGGGEGAGEGGGGEGGGEGEMGQTRDKWFGG